MSLRTALIVTFAVVLAVVVVYPLLPADEPPPLDPSAWVDLPPPPPIIEVPGTPGLPPAPPPPDANRASDLIPPSQDGSQTVVGGAAGNSCPGGVCPAPTYQPEQWSSGTYRRGLFTRRFR
jgi:hypothetical protein